MAAGDIRKMWKLHLVDQAILQIRARAAALDPGKQIRREIEVLQQAFDDKGGKAKALLAEQHDLELQQKAIEDKLKKIDKTLYGGQVVNPREVEAYEKEIAALKRQREANDARLLELLELVPPAKAEADRIEQAIQSKQADLKKAGAEALKVKSQLEAEFKAKAAERPLAAKDVPPALLSRYESVRQKNGGIAMAQINLRTGSCGVCGTLLPTKLVETAKEERLVTCEACHRILYYTEGLV
jgi:predicted  nucleic acid-binding Zn-ribbon protein